MQGTKRSDRSVSMITALLLALFAARVALAQEAGANADAARLFYPDLGRLATEETAGAAAPQRRLALLIANQDYDDPRDDLDRPYKDAEIVKAALLQAGFSPEDVFVRPDLDRDAMFAEVDAFAAKIAGAKAAGENVAAFFYYAGHGASKPVGYDDRENFFYPSGLDIYRADQLDRYGVEVEDVIDSLFRTRTASGDVVSPDHLIFVLDACRNSLFFDEDGRGASAISGYSLDDRGLPNLFLMYAAEDGETTPDDGAFAEALADGILLEGRDLVGVAAKVQKRLVDRRTEEYRTRFGGGARPPAVPAPSWKQSPGSSEFCFRLCPGQGAVRTETINTVKYDASVARHAITIHLEPDEESHKITPFLPYDFPIAIDDTPYGEEGAFRKVATQVGDLRLEGYANAGEVRNEPSSRGARLGSNSFGVDPQAFFEMLPGGGFYNPFSTRGQYASALIEALNEFGDRYEINTTTRIGHFLGQAAIETGFFRYKSENLNYSAEHLVQIFPRHFPDLETASRYARNPEAIANRVYANRLGNGDEASGDGWRYRGRGTFQLTGKDNYNRYAELSGFPILEDPDLLARDLVISAAVAMAAWQAIGLNEYADANDIRAVSRGVNRGNPLARAPAHGESERIVWTKRLVRFVERDLVQESYEPGERNPDVIRLHEDLASLGHMGGVVHDVFSPKTIEALHAFQSANDLEPTGQPDIQTRRKLDKKTGRADATEEKQGLKIGDRGPAVRDAQAALNLLGYNAGEEDGVFGPELKGAVADFQRENGLPTTGVVDPKTMDAIDEALEDTRTTVPPERGP